MADRFTQLARCSGIDRRDLGCAYGHVHEDERDLVVSGGLGCSIMPVRFGVVPEITVVELSGSAV